MRTRIIIMTAIAALLGVAYFMSTQRDTSDDASGPGRAVSKFYTNWLEYSEEPPTRQSLLDRLYVASPYVTNEFIKKMDAILADFDETGYDPITHPCVRTP
jgi:hypothetical protein